MPTIHIESDIKDISSTVLMPGDPKRCEYIAKKYLDNPKLINNVRGMTAYTGLYKGKSITIFPSGMGNASMGIYSYELFKDYNVQNIIRIGSCGGYNTKLKVNDIILVEKSVTKSSFGLVFNNYQSNTIEANIDLNVLISDTALTSKINLIKGNIYSTDVFYEKDNKYQEVMLKYDVLGVEMETFALFCNAKELNKKATALLTVSDLFFSDEKLSSKEREQSLDKMITLALDTSLKLT